MKITDYWKNGAPPTISFELFPAKTLKGKKNLDKVIEKLIALEPTFFSVTFGAGGSSIGGSYELVKELILEKQYPVLPYLACYGLGPETICEIVEKYTALGVTSLLAVRGDKPQDVENFVEHPDSFKYASDLISFLSKKYELCLGAAGYPEGHIAASSLEQDIAVLKEKEKNGAKFFITNYFYDNQYFFDFVERCREASISVPIIPGIMPIYNVKMMRNLAALCGARIPSALEAGLKQLPPENKAALHDFGVGFAVSQCVELLKFGVDGLHFYTMDKAKSSVAIVKELAPFLKRS